MGWDKEAYERQRVRDNLERAEKELERARAKLQALQPPPPVPPPAAPLDVELSDDEVAELLADDDQIDALVDQIMADDDDEPPPPAPAAAPPPADGPDVLKFSRAALRGPDGPRIQRELAAAYRGGGRKIQWEP